MYTFLLTVFLLFQTPAGASADSVAELGPKQIAKQTTYFEIEGGSIQGAEKFQNILTNSHFVALGELHNRVRLGELTQALLVHLKDAGFQNFAIETGPYSSEKLEMLSQNDINEVTKFYDRYSSKLFNIYPIPFFTGKGDLDFLSMADSLEYDLWGLDQEFAFSYKYLLDELVSLSNKPLSPRQQELHEVLSSTLYWWNRRSAVFSGFDIYCRLLNHDPLNEFLNSFANSGNPDINLITGAIEKSLHIYCKGGSPERIKYFKQNFDHNYQSALKENPAPRVFIKMGSYHAGRLKSPLGLYDIGNHVHQLADSLGQHAVHIRYLNRYYKGKDMLGQDGWTNSTHFMSAGTRDQWALIDLRPLRRQIQDGSLKASKYEQHEIQNYDFIILPPEDQMVTKHY